jgi:hypothetical protein
MVASPAEAGKLAPVLKVFDAAGTLLAAEVLGNDASTYSVQVRGVKPNAPSVS